jgi:hypothetical protein
VNQGEEVEGAVGSSRAQVGVDEGGHLANLIGVLVARVLDDVVDAIGSHSAQGAGE